MSTRFAAVELAPFELGPDRSLDDLIAASERLETGFLWRTEGYVGRLLLRKGENRFADLVFWRTAEDAERAMALAAASEHCRDYFACMRAADHDDPAHGVELFRVVQSYEVEAPAAPPR
jgi:hypothetical protein